MILELNFRRTIRPMGTHIFKRTYIKFSFRNNLKLSGYRATSTPRFSFFSLLNIRFDSLGSSSSFFWNYLKIRDPSRLYSPEYNYMQFWGPIHPLNGLYLNNTYMYSFKSHILYDKFACLTSMMIKKTFLLNEFSIRSELVFSSPFSILSRRRSLGRLRPELAWA